MSVDTWTVGSMMLTECSSVSRHVDGWACDVDRV